jgi:hypothetical protein
MTEDSTSVKLCDNRLIYTETNTMKQYLVENQKGPKLEGRKYPVMSSPNNILEMQAVDSKLFIFGGINTLNKLVNDKGYHMFDARER